MPRRNPAGHFTHVECRRRPTLPHPDECSTIGAGGLSFRVRDGTGRSPSATTTDNTIHISPLRGLNTPPHPHTRKPRCKKGGHGCVLRVTQWMRTTIHAHNITQSLCCGQALGLLVPVDSTPHRASIPGLSTPSSLGGLTHAKVVGDLILERASRLDAFSGYPFRT